MFVCSDVELVQQALEQNDLPPKYREYLKLRIEESSPVDYREITIPKPTFVAVSFISIRNQFALLSNWTSIFSAVGSKLEDSLDLIRDFTHVSLLMHLIVVLLVLLLKQTMYLQEVLACWQV